jgi:hypothetical protein
MKPNLNNISSCEYGKICSRFSFTYCRTIGYMSRCEHLGEFLRATAPEEREHPIDYHSDFGLVRRLK